MAVKEKQAKKDLCSSSSQNVQPSFHCVCMCVCLHTGIQPIDTLLRAHIVRQNNTPKPVATVPHSSTIEVNP